MQVKIWEQKTPSERVVELKLITTSNGVSLIVVNPDGDGANGGPLLHIRNACTPNLLENVS